MIYTLPAFDRAFKKLTKQQRQALSKTFAALESSFGKPHLHQGLGIRPFGEYYEFRVGLGLRVLFLRIDVDLALAFVGTHDECRAYLKNNS